MLPTCDRWEWVGGVAPLHLAPGFDPTTWEDTPESQFMVLVKVPLESVLRLGPLRQQDAVPVVRNASQGWRRGREIYRPGLCREWKPILNWLNQKGDFLGSRAEKSRFFPNVGSPDIPSLQTLPPPPRPWLCVTALG